MMSRKHEFFYFSLYCPKCLTSLFILFLFIINCSSVILWRAFHHFVQIVIVASWTAGRISKGASRPASYRESFYWRMSSTKDFFFKAFSSSSNNWTRIKTGNSESTSPMMPLNHRGSASSCAKIQISYYYYSYYCIPARMGWIWYVRSEWLICVQFVPVSPHQDIKLMWYSFCQS